MDKSVETVDNPRPIDNLAPWVEGTKVVLGIFAKEPVAGRVKTRLCPPLSAAEAAALYRSCLEETVAAMGGAGFDLVLFLMARPTTSAVPFPASGFSLRGKGTSGRE
ncbi:MAG TPA: hypothetical protein VD811_08920, partial [Desulfuromonadales bacterium]|nr:hypothetical protein [Desulfuromonadales bacterium]